MSDANQETHAMRMRFIVLALCACLVAFLLTLRLGQLQLLHQQDSQDIIHKNIIRVKRIPPVRGLIYSSDGKLLADNQQAFSIDFYLPEFLRGRASANLVTAEYIHEMAKNYSEGIQRPLLYSVRTLRKEIGSDSKGKLVLEGELTLMKNLSRGQEELIQRRNLPKFFYTKRGQLICDLSKVPAQDKEGARTRTAKSILKISHKISLLTGKEIDFTIDEVAKHMRSYPALPFTAFKGMSPQQITPIIEEFPNESMFQLTVTPKRVYPYSWSMSHLLGFTAPISPDYDNIEKDEQRYFLKILSGRIGLERTYNKELSGKGGKELLEVNPSGFHQEQKEDEKQASVIEKQEDKVIPPEHGQIIHLTLDAEAQEIAYKAMGNKRGSIVVTDIYTGEIIVMVSTPSYDLTTINKNYGKFLKEDRTIPRVFQDYPLRNRALWAENMPGSIVKPLIALKSLEKGLIHPEEQYHCDGAFRLGKGPNARIKCNARWGHGDVDLSTALMRSCNPYFINCSTQFTAAELHQTYTHAGFGKRLLRENLGRSIEHEIPGKLFDPVLDDKLFERALLGIGQGKISVSPLQTTVYTAALANGGQVIAPTLIKEIRGSLNKKVLWKHQANVISQLPGNAENLKAVQAGMLDVIHGQYATAKAAKSKKIKLAGKTGTAQVTYFVKNPIKGLGSIKKKSHNYWFICFGPWENPRYACTVFVQREKDEPSRGGGSVSAPIAKKFFEEYLDVLKKRQEKESPSEAVQP